MPSLNWIGKSDVEKHVREIPTRLLHCDRELSFEGALSSEAAPEFSPARGNLLIEGDNLLALKALLPFYKNQIKCITIDPPYNTGNEGWIYNDNVNSPQIRAWLGKTVDGEDLSRHDKWLCMMRPRLEFHHQLLREDGAIFISIDDNEIHHLRALCNEIFGASNFVANIIWQKRYSRENRDIIGDAHDYILVYAKDADMFKRTKRHIPINEAQAKVYKNPNGDPRGRWRGVPMTAQGFRPNQMYEITTPGGVTHTPPAGRCWSMVETEYQKLLAQDRIYFGKDGKAQPQVIRYLSEVKGMTPWTWWPHEEAGHNDEAKKELYEILGKGAPFDTPKPTRLIERILQISTEPGDIVLDSFAGSGTTAHAVLKLNAQDPEATPRRFVLVEMESKIARPITRERLVRAIGGHGKHPPLPGDFRFCHLGEPVLDAHGGVNPRASWRDLAHFFYLDRFQTAPDMTQLDPQTGFVGKAGGISLYLLFDSQGIAPLDAPTWKKLMAVPGIKMVYCESVGVPTALLERAQIATFVVPYEVAF